MTKITIIGDKFRQGTITFRNILTNRYGTKKLPLPTNSKLISAIQKPPKIHTRQAISFFKKSHSTRQNLQNNSILFQIVNHRYPISAETKAKSPRLSPYFSKPQPLFSSQFLHNSASFGISHTTSLIKKIIIRIFIRSKQDSRQFSDLCIYHNPKSASSSHINFHRQAMIFPQHPSNSTKNPNSAALSPISRLSKKKKKKRSLTILDFDILDTIAMIRFGQIYLLTL